MWQIVIELVLGAGVLVLAINIWGIAKSQSHFRGLLRDREELTRTLARVGVHALSEAASQVQPVCNSFGLTILLWFKAHVVSLNRVRSILAVLALAILGISYFLGPIYFGINLLLSVIPAAFLMPGPVMKNNADTLVRIAAIVLKWHRNDAEWCRAFCTTDAAYLKTLHEVLVSLDAAPLVSEHIPDSQRRSNDDTVSTAKRSTNTSMSPPKDAFAKAILAMSQRNPEAAIAAWSDVLRRSPEDAKAYIMRGTKYRTTGKNAKAITDYTEAIRLDPTYANAYGYRAAVYMDMGDLDRTIEDCTAAIRLDSYLADAYGLRGNAHFLKGELAKAVVDFTNLIQWGPQDALAYRSRGLAHDRNGQQDKAIADYTHVIELCPNEAEGYALRGWAYLRASVPDDSIRDCTEAIRRDPKRGDAYYCRGAAHLTRGNRDKAASDLDQAKKLGFKPQ